MPIIEIKRMMPEMISPRMASLVIFLYLCGDVNAMMHKINPAMVQTIEKIIPRTAYMFVP